MALTSGEGITLPSGSAGLVPSEGGGEVTSPVSGGGVILRVERLLLLAKNSQNLEESLSSL